MKEPCNAATDLVQSSETVTLTCCMTHPSNGVEAHYDPFHKIYWNVPEDFEGEDDG